ncbi:hypothetical protein [Kineococcus gypseus]|uniref:hypothetical protein n=1 Tax=Kineococcus gypseus TaxID=1637102 RepID=UPI003D7E9C70
MSQEHEDVLRVVDWVARLTDEDRSELVARVRGAGQQEASAAAPAADGRVALAGPLPHAQVVLPEMAGTSASA